MPLTIAKIKQIRQINTPNGEKLVFFEEKKIKVESKKMNSSVFDSLEGEIAQVFQTVSRCASPPVKWQQHTMIRRTGGA